MTRQKPGTWQWTFSPRWSTTPGPVGDYASGTNHVLPTGGCARMFSGLSVDDFIKKPTFQHLTREALRSLKDTVITLACLLYTSDAADEEDSVDLGGRR